MSEFRPTVLIVDDEENVVDSLRRTLRHEHVRVITTTSPVEALAHLDQGEIDILISDIDMPEMTGLELVAEARRRHPNVVRILLTGDSSLESALTAINDGAVYKYLTKPWRSQELRETLRAATVQLGALRQQAASAAAGERDRTLRTELEARYPGITSVRRVDGAYLLNDMRAAELLAALDGASTFVARAWMPLGVGATEDLRRS